MELKQMPKTAGILSIISGVLGIVGAIPIGWVVRGVVGFGTSGAVMIPIVVVAGPILILGILALIGGFSSLNRRNWGLALTGAICSVIFLLGIPAIVLLILSRKEFRRP